MKLTNNSVLTIVVIIALLSIVPITFFILNPLNASGLGFEGGIITKEGQVIPLDEPTWLTKNAAWDVNSQTVQEGDYVYWRFWLNARAIGIPGQVTNIRFKLSQSIEGE
ncbi:unnamed protein product, partial [marine sediment metagenome]